MRDTIWAITEQEKLVAESDNRMLKSIAQNGLRELEKELTSLQHEARLTQDKINVFPEFNMKLIKKNAKEYRDILLKNNREEVQAMLNKCIRIIKMNNETVETVIDVQALLDAYIPLGISITEKRDRIARPENHAARAMHLSTISVKVG